MMGIFGGMHCKYIQVTDNFLNKNLNLKVHLDPILSRRWDQKGIREGEDKCWLKCGTTKRPFCGLILLLLLLSS